MRFRRASVELTIATLVTREPRIVAPCLEAIAQARLSVPASELVIVLAAADPATRDLVTAAAPDARLIVAPTGINVGLGPAQNLAFTLARAPRVVLVHEDAQPHPRAFDALMAASDAYPPAAVVGARMLDPHGDLQAAGAVVWRDGRVSTVTGSSGLRRIEQGDPFPVDASGMAGTLVDRMAWEAVGGFDERFFPAFYGDIDLCLAAWGHGRTVLCAPRAIVHHAREAMVDARRGASGSGDFRAFLLERQRERFVAKWRDGLAELEPLPLSEAEPELIERALERSARRAAGLPGMPTLRANRGITGGSPRGVDGEVERRLLGAQVVLQREFADHLLERSRVAEREVERLRRSPR